MLINCTKNNTQDVTKVSKSVQKNEIPVLVCSPKPHCMSPLLRNNISHMLLSLYTPRGPDLIH